jgi:hypothetical protein
MMIVNDAYRVVNKLEASSTDDARIIIYNRHMFTVQATALNMRYLAIQPNLELKSWLRQLLGDLPLHISLPGYNQYHKH